MSYEIIAQPAELIAQFVALRRGRPDYEPWGNFRAIGLVRRNTLIAGVVYNNFEAANVCAHIGAIEGCHWLTPHFLRAMFDYPFNEMGKRRITALCARKNKRARRFVEKLGFKVEGTLSHYYDRDDLIVYGMLKGNCQFIAHPRQLEAA